MLNLIALAVGDFGPRFGTRFGFRLRLLGLGLGLIEIIVITIITIGACPCLGRRLDYALRLWRHDDCIVEEKDDQRAEYDGNNLLAGPIDVRR